MLQTCADTPASFQPLKTINDPVHGTIEVHSFAQLIMDRPQFQRLRRLKQLALTDLVYPSATKNRFEHSVGTYHLARELGKKLRVNLTEAQFSEDEALCVGIAGLCHDLGHGPYSHLWESLLASQGISNHHEGMSVQVFDSIVDDIARMPDPESRKLAQFMDCPWRADSSRTHRQLIGDLILGGPDGDPKRIPPEKQFLYEIVNNKRTGFDVDKMDYMNRDSQSLGLTGRFDAIRQLSLLRVLPCPASQGADAGSPRMLLVLRDKQVLDYINLLVARRQMHYLAYQHVKSVAFEKVLQDAFTAAREHLQRHRSDPTTNLRAVQCLVDGPGTLETLLWLTDDRLMELLKNNCGEEAARLMKQLDERGKYRYLASVSAALHSDEEQQRTAYQEQLKAAKRAVTGWNKSHPAGIAELRVFDYGTGLRHPLREVFCYTKAGHVRQCNGDSGQATNMLFSDLQLAALHITVVRLYERTLTEAAAGCDSQRKQLVDDFYEAMKECGYKPTAE